MDNDFMNGYVYGVLCSKGTLIYDEKKSIYVISLEMYDNELFSIFTDIWSELHGEGFNIYEKVIREKKHFSFKLYDKKIVRRFYYNHALRTGSSRWKMPRDVLIKSEMKKGFLSGFFDSGCYIRTRIRERRGKREKIRNIRVVSPNRPGLESIKNLLFEFGIKPIIYSSGKNFCLDIEGKMKIESFQEKIGFVSQRNKTRLYDVLTFLG